MDNQQKPALWNRNFVQCCISYFLMNFSFYLLMPTLPVYLTEELHMTEGTIGLILSAYTLGLLFVRPLSGYLVDCFSRKLLYLWAFAAFALMFAGYFWASTMLAIALVRLLQGGFMGLTSVSGNTIAVDVIPSVRRGEGMGFYGLTINLAMSLAPLVAVYLYGKSGFNRLIAFALLAALIGMISVCFIRYPKRANVARPVFSFDRFILLNALPAAFSYILVAIPYGMIVSFVVLYGNSIGIAHAGHFFLYMAIGVGISRLISGRLVDRGKIHHVAIASLLCLIIAFALFATCHSTFFFFGCALLIGAGFGVGVPAFQCLFVNVAPHHRRGTATSTFLTSFDIGVGIGMLSAGFIGTRFGLAVAYGIGAVCCLLAALVYLKWVYASFERNRLL